MIMIKTQFQWKTNKKWCVILNDLVIFGHASCQMHKQLVVISQNKV